MCGEEGEDAQLPAISTVGECAYINFKEVNGKEGWECQWCGLSFKPRHATRAMRHVLKLKGGDIAICKAVISARYRDRYQALYDRSSILYVSAKIKQSRIMCDRLEKLDATENNAMFGDDDINFDMQLERFDVDTGALKEPAVERIFRAWVEDWEEEARKKNDCVEEARLLTKYKGLVFNDPDSGSTFSVWDRNMEFRRGRGNR